MYSWGTPSGHRNTLELLKFFCAVVAPGPRYTLGALMKLPRTSSFGHHQPRGKTCFRSVVEVSNMLTGGNLPLLASMYTSRAIEICRMLLAHCTTAACRRAACSAG